MPYLEQLSKQMQNWCSSLKCSLFTRGMPPYVHYNQPIITSKVLQEISYSMVQLLISRFRVCVAVLTWDLFWNTSESSSVFVNAWLAAAMWLLKAMCLVFWSAALGAPRSLLKLQCTETETHTFPTECSCLQHLQSETPMGTFTRCLNLPPQLAALSAKETQIYWSTRHTGCHVRSPKVSNVK